MYIADKVVADSCRYDREFCELAIEKIGAALDAVIGALGSENPTFDVNAGLIEKHGRAILNDSEQRRALVRYYFPILKNEHLILGNVFTVNDYLSESRFDLFKDFVELSPYGQHKKEVYKSLAKTAVDVDSLIFPCRSEQRYRPVEHAAQLTCLFFSLFANARGASIDAAYRLFNHYNRYRDCIFISCIGISDCRYSSSFEAGVQSGQERADDEIGILDKLVHVFLRCLIEEHRESVSPFHRLCRLFEKKSPYASMHHTKVSVNGKNLAQAFSEECFDSIKFTQGILESSWFDRGRPEDSLFFKRLTAFGGPMFGVFSDAELADIKAGVAANAAELEAPVHENAHLFTSLVKDIEALYRSGSQRIGSVPEKSLNLRSMYHRLITRNFSPELDAQCLQYVRATINKARNINVAKELGQEFNRFPYSKENLLRRLDAIYKTQMRSAQSVSAVDIDIRALRAMHFTFSPTSFIDGCWLENIPKMLQYDPNVTGKLFDIYYDELGSGSYRYNHVRIFAELLKELEIKLPAPYSTEFAEHKSIADNGFPGPVFMLAISRHIDDLFPELLGFTLSVELFGLGGFYQYMLSQLQRHKIDANFYGIHISVDNLSTGHSSIAAKAVINYLEEMTDRVRSNDIAELLWNRVWDGFLASRYLLK